MLALENCTFFQHSGVNFSWSPNRKQRQAFLDAISLDESDQLYHLNAIMGGKRVVYIVGIV